MRKVTFGSSVFIAGVIAAALLLAGSMSASIPADMLSEGQYSAFWILSQCGLLPVFIGFACAALIGLVIAIVGLFTHEHRSEGHSHRSERRSHSFEE